MIFKAFWRKKITSIEKKTEPSSSLEHFKYKTAIEIRFADLDMMGHVNNAIYFTYMEISRAKYWKQAINWDWTKIGVVVAKASINYLKPIHLGDLVSVYIRTSRIGESSFDLEYLMVKKQFGKEVLCSTGSTVCVAYDYNTKAPMPIPQAERNKIIAFEQLAL